MIGVLIDMLEKSLSLGRDLPAPLHQVFSALGLGVQDAGFYQGNCGNC